MMLAVILDGRYSLQLPNLIFQAFLQVIYHIQGIHASRHFSLLELIGLKVCSLDASHSSSMFPLP